MKSKLVALLMIFAFATNAMAQLPIDEETGKVVFTDVVQMEGMTKDDIYKKAKMWIVSTLKSGDNMVELDGSNSDQIIGTGNLIIPDSEINKQIEPHSFREYILNFKFIVYCKENRLKYSVENFNLSFIVGIAGQKNCSLLAIETDIMRDKKEELFKNVIHASVKKHIDNLVQDFINSIKKEEEEW